MGFAVAVVWVASDTPIPCDSISYTTSPQHVTGMFEQRSGCQASSLAKTQNFRH